MFDGFVGKYFLGLAWRGWMSEREEYDISVLASVEHSQP